MSDRRNKKTAKVGDMVYWYLSGDLKNTPVPGIVTHATAEGILELVIFPAGHNRPLRRSGVRYQADPYFNPDNKKAVQKRQRQREELGVWDYREPPAKPASKMAEADHDGRRRDKQPAAAGN